MRKGITKPKVYGFDFPRVLIYDQTNCFYVQIDLPYYMKFLRHVNLAI